MLLALNLSSTVGCIMSMKWFIAPAMMVSVCLINILLCILLFRINEFIYCSCLCSSYWKGVQKTFFNFETFEQSSIEHFYIFLLLKLMFKRFWHLQYVGVTHCLAAKSFKNNIVISTDFI